MAQAQQQVGIRSNLHSLDNSFTRPASVVDAEHALPLLQRRVYADGAGGVSSAVLKVPRPCTLNSSAIDSDTHDNHQEYKQPHNVFKNVSYAVTLQSVQNTAASLHDKSCC
eukprot:17188-Heterococcus_DN1.PRE.2